MIAANAVGYPYTAEIFPTRARATATSVGDGFGGIKTTGQNLTEIAH